MHFLGCPADAALADSARSGYALPQPPAPPSATEYPARLSVPAAPRAGPGPVEDEAPSLSQKAADAAEVSGAAAAGFSLCQRFIALSVRACACDVHVPMGIH